MHILTFSEFKEKGEVLVDFPEENWTGILTELEDACFGVILHRYNLLCVCVCIVFACMHVCVCVCVCVCVRE